VDLFERMSVRSDAKKSASDKATYEAKQDAIKNFALFGGYDPEQVMAGAEQVSRLGDEQASNFQDAMARPANYVMKAPYNQPPTKEQFDPAAARAYEGFKDMVAGKKRQQGLSFEEKKELLDKDYGLKKELKQTQGGGTVDKYANLGGGKPAALDTGSDTSSAVKGWWTDLFNGKKKEEKKKDTLGIY